MRGCSGCEWPRQQAATPADGPVATEAVAFIPQLLSRRRPAAGPPKTVSQSADSSQMHTTRASLKCARLLVVATLACAWARPAAGDLGLPGRPVARPGVQANDREIGAQLRPRGTAADNNDVVIRNDVLLVDTTGRRVKVADSSLVQFGGRFWLYGATYHCSGVHVPRTGNLTCPPCAWYDTKFAAYSSADLSANSWSVLTPPPKRSTTLPK